MVLTRRQAALQDEPLTSLSEQEAELKEERNGRAEKSLRETPTWVVLTLLAFAVVTVVTFPHPFHPHGEPSLQHVFYYGWLTALSTGLGVVPFIFLPDVAVYWVGISNGELDVT